MDSNEKVITNFETRVRQLILRFQDLKKENEELYTMVEKAEQEVKDLQAKLTQKDNDYKGNVSTSSPWRNAFRLKDVK